MVWCRGNTPYNRPGPGVHSANEALRGGCAVAVRPREDRQTVAYRRRLDVAILGCRVCARCLRAFHRASGGANAAHGARRAKAPRVTGAHNDVAEHGRHRKRGHGAHRSRPERRAVGRIHGLKLVSRVRQRIENAAAFNEALRLRHAGLCPVELELADIGSADRCLTGVVAVVWTAEAILRPVCDRPADKRCPRHQGRRGPTPAPVPRRTLFSRDIPV